MKENQKRMLNFLLEDLRQLKKDIKENKTEEINIFFSYWKQHAKQLITK